MIEDLTSKEDIRCNIQGVSQSLINKHLQDVLEITTAKYQKELLITQKYEEELSKIKEEYSKFLAGSESRESSLLEMLQSKDQEIGEHLSRLDSLKQASQKMTDDQKVFESDLLALKNEKYSEIDLDCQGCQDNYPTDFTENLVTQLENIKAKWEESGEDSWEEHNKLVKTLTEKTLAFEEELNSQISISSALETENNLLEEHLEKLNASNELSCVVEEKLKETESEYQEATEEYNELQHKFKILKEKLVIYNMDKEVISNKLIKILDQLDQEKKSSNDNTDLIIKEKENMLRLQENLKNEQKLNSEISENVIQEKMNISRAREQLLKTTDLDMVLIDTLKKISMEGVIKKTDEGFIHNNNLIQLQLHNETFVVVKIGAGLMPLTDYLKNTYLPGAIPHNKATNSEPKIENCLQETKETKSPMKNLVSPAIKASKTPLRDRNHSIGERKKPFK